MKIRITKGHGWYKNEVGKVFEVTGRADEWNAYYVKVWDEDANWWETKFYFVKDGNYEIVEAEDAPAKDAVHSPSHYQNAKFETIEIIEEITKGYNDGYIAYCVGNALKYLARAPFKHGEPTEDLAKAGKYIEFAVAYLKAKEAGE